MTTIRGPTALLFLAALAATAAFCGALPESSEFKSTENANITEPVGPGALPTGADWELLVQLSANAAAAAAEEAAMVKEQPEAASVCPCQSASDPVCGKQRYSRHPGLIQTLRALQVQHQHAAFGKYFSYAVSAIGSRFSSF